MSERSVIVINPSLPAWPDRIRLDGRFKLLWVLRDRMDGRGPGAESSIAYDGLMQSVRRAKHRGYPPYEQLSINPPIFADGVRDGKVEGLPRVFVFNQDHTVCLVLHPLKN